MQNLSRLDLLDARWPSIDDQLFFILGPCVIESHDHCVMMATRLHTIARELGISVLFKASFDKANRTSHRSFRGCSLAESLRALHDVRAEVGLPTLTDVHVPEQCDVVAPYVDVLQIPALLCRQTDLLVAAARTGRTVNIKKGQFMSPAEMRWAVEKVTEHGGRAMLCERGTFFGYNELVNDFKGIRIMKSQGECPVIFDATHSVQRPGFRGSSSGGDRAFVWDLARAAVAVGVDGVFIETHDAPDEAPSDGATMVSLEELRANLPMLVKIDALVKSGAVDRSTASPHSTSLERSTIGT